MEECLVDNGIIIGIGATVTLISILTNCILYNLYNKSVTITPRNSPTSCKKKFYKLSDVGLSIKKNNLNRSIGNTLYAAPKNIKIRRLNKSNISTEKPTSIYVNNNLPQWVIDDYKNKSQIDSDTNTVSNTIDEDTNFQDIELGIELQPCDIYDITHC